MNFSLSDLQVASDVARRVDPSPVKLAGRLLGLSGPEQETRAPAWGLIALGAGAGFLLGFWASRADLLQRVLGRQ